MLFRLVCTLRRADQRWIMKLVALSGGQTLHLSTASISSGGLGRPRLRRSPMLKAILVVGFCMAVTP